MAESETTILRLAEPGDAPVLGTAALAAGGGLYEHLLEPAAKGLDAATILASAIASGADALSWRNGIIAAAGAAADAARLGAVIAYEGAAFGLAPAIAAAATQFALDDLAGLFAAKPPGDSFYLHAIWVDPAARGQGVGALLLDAVMAIGADAGFAQTSLHVWADNAPARGLYESRGFRIIAEIPVPRRPRMAHDGGKLLLST